jgi:putative colanic acid biosynthesis UDP-glucose lipid carrier transferase
MNRFRSFLSKAKNARPIAILGNSPEADAFAEMLKNHPEYGLRKAVWFGQEKDQIPIEDAETWLKENKIAELFCALKGNDANIGAWLKLADANLIRFRYLPALGIKNITNASVELMGDVPVLIPRKEPLEYRHNRLLKRLFDLIFSTFVILIIYPVTFPFIAIAIKLSSKGPIFFKQQRSGLNNAVFNVLKFRTMTVNPEADSRQATKGDERITGIGHFLRKHNLDELPQFVNVLVGHMSVVGPRPHMLNHTAAYRKLIDEFMVRHFIKPGITGLAQTRGLRGETQNPEQMRDRVKADVYYLENWSLLLDLKIVVETIWNMVLGENQKEFNDD